MVETFRLKKSVHYLGMVSTALFLAALVGCLSIFFLDEPGRHGFEGEHSVAIVGGMGLAVSGTLLLFSAYLWAAFYVEAFTIRGATCLMRSMLQKHQFEMSELECLKWRVVPAGGSVVFRTADAKSYLDLHGYTADDQIRIITVLHDLAPPSIQEGWPAFCHHVALPLRDGRSSDTRSEPPSACVTITRERYDRLAAYGVPLSIAVAMILGILLHRWQFVALPPFVIAAWLLLRFSTRPGGYVQTRLSATSRGRGALVWAGALVGSQLLSLGLQLAGVEASTACLVGSIVLCAACLPLLYLMHAADKRRRITDAQAIESAPGEWLQRQSQVGEVEQTAP